MLHHQLHLGNTVIFVGIKPKSNPGEIGECIGVTEPDCIVLLAIFFEQEFQVLFLEYTLISYPEVVAKHRWREALTPYLLLHELDEVDRIISIFEWSVGFDYPFQLILCQPVLSHCLKRRRKGVKAFCPNG